MNKKTIIIAAVILGVFSLLYYLFGKNKSDEQLAIDNESATTTLVATATSTESVSSTVIIQTPVTTQKTTAASKTTAPISATQKYLDALKLYKPSGYYFQFVSCHGLPGSLTMKKGKKFMLDNRDNVSRKIVVVDGQSFKIAAYSYAIATAPTKLGTHYITCDGGGAASIMVQQ